MRRLAYIIVLGAFFFSSGGHWYLLQRIAWINMIRSYAEVVPLSEAVRMTFSDEHPSI